MAKADEVTSAFGTLNDDDQLSVLKEIGVGRLLRAAQTLAKADKSDEDQLIAGEIDDIRRRYVGKHGS